ncbi:MAG: trigger factor [Candidatus Omnitrophica bacterium]|nr:trigger factor [Candidatus Omnitrophota bacterium]
MMKVINIEDVSKTKRKLTLEIEPEDMQTEREEAYQELGKQAVLPGFRPGHVPRQMLEWRFDKDVRKEAFGEALQKAFEKATEDNKLHVVGRPDIDDEQIEKGQEEIVESPVSLDITFEVVPEFEPADYKDQTIEVEEYEVQESDVDRIIQSTRERSAFYNTVDDRKTQKGDYLVVDVKATRDGEDVPGLSAKETMLSGLCEDEEPSDFEKAFLDREKGEEFEFDFTLPEDHPLVSEEGSNEIHVRAKVRQINQRTLPALDDEFAKDLGFDTVEAYREKVREDIEHYGKHVIEDRKRSKLIEQILDKTEVFVPAVLTQTNYIQMKWSRDMENRRYGRSDDSLSAEEKSALESETMFEAEQAAKQRLVLTRIAEEEKLEVSDDEYFQAMAARAAERGETNVDKYLAQIDRDGLEERYKESILLDKTVDWLVEHNEFKMVKPKKK